MSRLLYQAELHRQDDRVAAGSNAMRFECQSPFTESNRRPSPYHGDALPTELKGRARRAVADSTAPATTASHGGRPAGQVRTKNLRCVAPGAALRTPVRASSHA